jgi:hypothetical protein
MFEFDAGVLDKFYVVGTSHMSDNRQMSVAMQRLVDFISMVTNSTLLCNNTGANSTLLRNNGKKLRFLLGPL